MYMHTAAKLPNCPFGLNLLNPQEALVIYGKPHNLHFCLGPHPYKYKLVYPNLPIVLVISLTNTKYISCFIVRYPNTGTFCYNCTIHNMKYTNLSSHKSRLHLLFYIDPYLKSQSNYIAKDSKAFIQIVTFELRLHTQHSCNIFSNSH